MKASVVSKLSLLACGFAMGFLYSILHESWHLWPFENNAVFNWVRWTGKESIKWGFIGIVSSVALFLTIQVLNGLMTTWQLYGHHPQQGPRRTIRRR